MVEQTEGNSNSNFKSREAAQIRHAVIVLNRLIRSKRASDVLLQDRVFRAAKIAQAASNSETALISGRPADAVYRIASRIVRNMAASRTTDMS
jgi:hypothetical protein